MGVQPVQCDRIPDLVAILKFRINFEAGPHTPCSQSWIRIKQYCVKSCWSQISKKQNYLFKMLIFHSSWIF